MFTFRRSISSGMIWRYKAVVVVGSTFKTFHQIVHILSAVICLQYTRKPIFAEYLYERADVRVRLFIHD